MVAQSINYDNIGSFIQEFRSSIEEGCRVFSYRSIAEKALVNLCRFHYYAASLQLGDRFIHEDETDRANKAFLLPSKLQSPHYLTCFSSVNSVSARAISDLEFGQLCYRTQLWLLLTEILYSHVLSYFEFFNFDDQTLAITFGVDWDKLNSETDKYRKFFADYYEAQTCSVRYSIEKLYEFALSDALAADDFIYKEKGFRP